MYSASAEFTGLSGRRYAFVRYDRIPHFKTRLPCVYCIARPSTRLGQALRPLYVGQTEDFNACCASLHAPTLRLERGDVLLILRLNDPVSRRGIHADILMGLYRDDSLSSRHHGSA